MVDKARNLSEKLKNTDSNEVYKALIEIKEKYVRYHDKMRQLQKYSVIKLIIPFIEHPKYCSISLSIIADGCLELSFVNEVIKYNGIKSLMNIMKSFVTDDIQSKACRALGNMAKFEVGFKAVLLVNPISIVVNFLSETSNDKCKQVAVRTLMILGKSPKTRELIIEKNGINCIAKLLHSSNVHLLTCSTRAFANFTQNCNLSFARLLSELQIFKVFVDLYNHADKAVQNNALVSLKNLTAIEEIRSCLVKSGAVKLFTEVLSTCKSKETSRLAAFALCKCLDHLHMWRGNGTSTTDGLKALIGILQNNEHQDIHLQVIASLLPLAYEHKVSTILLKLNILEILIKILELYIEKHKCKSLSVSLISNFASGQSVLNSEEDIDKMVTEFHSYASNCAHSMQAKKSDIEIYNSVPIPNLCPLDFSSPITHAESEYLCDFSAVTSDYCSVSSSPDRLSSPTLSLSPDIKSDIDSPLSGPWSPVLSESGNESSSSYSTCHSPTISTYSNSVNMNSPSRTVSPGIRLALNSSPSDQLSSVLEERENSPTRTLSPDIRYDYNNSLSSGQWSPIVENEKITNHSIFDSPTSTVADIFRPSSSKLDDPKEPPTKLLKKCNVYELSHNLDSNVHSAQKKIKTENLNKDLLKYQPQDPDDSHISKSDSNSVSDSKQLARQTIDYFVITFIWRLYSFLKKKTNSQMADKFFFTVIIDYLCFIHNPCPQAETLLLCLVKNRYFFEKLIGNGFISELNEKFLCNYSCIHRSCVNQMYEKIKRVGGQEAESHFGIGTLSHILATSSKVEQFHTICAISKLVTQKSSLHKLLFQANGLSLLFSFLSDSNIITQRGAIVSLCELYQTLTKEDEKRDCCFLGTCNLESSVRCSYKESFFNVTFVMNNGVKILANREKICENSDYFNCLLNGYFLEREAKQITLSDISEKNLIIIFHFLHGCGSSSYCPFIKRLPFSVLLELLSDCDRFLFLNIKSFVEDRLCHYIYPVTVSKIFRQSKIHNSPALMKRSLDFALKMNVLQKDTLYNTFDELSNLEPNLNFFGELETVIKNLFDFNK